MAVGAALTHKKSKTQEKLLCASLVMGLQTKEGFHEAMNMASI